MGRDEKGNLEYIDFSRTNPYDYLSRPFRALINELDNSGKLSRNGYEKVADAAMREFI